LAAAAPGLALTAALRLLARREADGAPANTVPMSA